MSLTSVPQISPQNLERILQYLPEPSLVKVGLGGGFDYSTFIRQAKQLVGITLDNPEIVFQLHQPTKKNILDIYKKSYFESVEERIERFNPEEKMIWFKEAIWSDDDHSILKLTSIEFEVHYRGSEPNYIAKVRREIEKMEFRMRININN